VKFLCACGHFGKTIGDDEIDPPIRCAACNRPALGYGVGEELEGPSTVPAVFERALMEILATRGGRF
jgi:hypothetical protein